MRTKSSRIGLETDSNAKHHHDSEAQQQKQQQGTPDLQAGI